ncbi:MAG: hypothetical protein CSB55_07270 [Candidatus Cloacimonadota bacterium]|nr:MAG: hypothetical protein CSB55_07270 [Candidatus Cloacimonadota bacterium]
MNKKDLIYYVSIFIIAVSVWFYNYEKKRRFQLNELLKLSQNSKIIPQNELKSISSVKNIDFNKLEYIYYLNLTDCSTCINDMFFHIDKSLSKNIHIKLIITYPDYEQTKNYVNNMLNDYKNKIDIFYCEKGKFIEHNIMRTPLLIILDNSKKKIGFIFGMNLKWLKIAENKL